MIQGDQLAEWVRIASHYDCAMLFDEFYSHYVWNPEGARSMISAAEYVADVNRDPVVLFDGLTKNWRYPGWRVTWTLGPRKVIDAVASAGSFLDGGGSKPLQRAAIPMFTDVDVEAEARAIQSAFRPKRDQMVDRLRAMGIRVDHLPEGTFYVWGDVSELAPALSDGMSFFREALNHQVITVPGEFFDINPGKRRSHRGSRFRSHVRFSFGPSQTLIDSALSRLRTMIESTP